MASYHLSVKVGAKGKAAAHAEYIEREGEYKLKHQEKLEATEHGNMPPWAQDDRICFGDVPMSLSVKMVQAIGKLKLLYRGN